MTRPFFYTGIDQLEAEFQRRRSDLAFLAELIDELAHRSTPRAAQLREQVRRAFAVASQTPSPSPVPRTPETTRVPSRAAPIPVPPRSPSTSLQNALASRPSLTNTPASILDAWTALEVLSPPTFRRPEDLAGGNRHAVAELARGRLPWEGRGEASRKGYRLYYQVVLGSIKLEQAVNQLLARYADSRAERPAARGEAILAMVTLDQAGRPVESPTGMVSSFAWGLPRALGGDLVGLAQWRSAEAPILQQLDGLLRREDANGNVLPIDRAVLHTVFQGLVRILGLPGDFVEPPCFAVRSYVYYRSAEPPEPLLLNSFFLNDLASARTAVERRREPPLVRLYLGGEPSTHRADLLHDTTVLEAAVAPGAIPPARWPGRGRHSLVLLQQAAVNLAERELRDRGILAVNGPPGTGKTTLLRDLVAATVAGRAEAMLAFDDPADAFVHSGQKMPAGQGWLHLYRLDPRLRGFEMVVASSNNKAVENVSAELPGRKAVAEDAEDLRYFTTVSDALREQESWGLVAAVLGNGANRARFSRVFWWDEEVGMSWYLAAAAGIPQVREKKDPDTGQILKWTPRVVTAESAPRDHAEALQRWKRARTRFTAALKSSRDRLTELERVRQAVRELPSLAQALSSAAHVLTAARTVEHDAEATLRHEQARDHQARERLARARSQCEAHEAQRPGLFSRLFRTRGAREWKSTYAYLTTARREAEGSCTSVLHDHRAAEGRLQAARAERERSEGWAGEVRRRYDSARHQVEQTRVKRGVEFIDAEFFTRDHAERHLTVPWLTNKDQRLRDDVFVAAMQLHKAFIDAAAKPLRHNLGVLMSTFGRGLRPEQQPLIPDLWTSLFLVVPLISTTFASMERMFGPLPPESLGWLLVDEAGQALPQAAIGALLRARRAIVVGDPMQIEPVVVLPEALTQAICQHFGVDPDRFNAPTASVQTLADAATPFVAEFEGRQGSRTVGVPLLVHRRCDEPMFGISNAIAYERLMVQAKTPGASPVREVLGPSAWFDVQGSGQDKWCPEEGQVVLRLLRRLADAGVVPDLYIVTPFVVVAESLRRLVLESEVLAGWREDPRAWASERIGTVHTVQGREAEAVIFVLGAPEPQQSGARNWAGARPNLLNVAVSRAKEQLYVVGNRQLWREAGLFHELDARMS